MVILSVDVVRDSASHRHPASSRHYGQAPAAGHHEVEDLREGDAGFAAQMTSAFERDLARARRITLAGWEGRPLGEKARERLAALLRSQL